MASERPPSVTRESVPELTPGRRGDVIRAVDAVLDLPQDERARFLEKMYAGDAELRREVERLVSACERAESTADFLREPAVRYVEPLLADLRARATTAEAAVPAALAAALAGRYVIDRALGRGGAATVYLARDLKHERLVAIKVLHPELSRELGVRQFFDEIRRTAQLHHPHIVQLLDSGEADGLLFYVMPYMDGGTLRQRLAREKQLPIPDAIAIARVIAEALDHAHRHGLIHRDVKPENILFADGEVCLADFGIARAMEDSLDQNSTSRSIVRGTVAYMSPEQAGGERDYDGRSDIFSLGCVLYEMLAGMQAFAGPTPEMVLAMRFTHRPRDLRVYRPTVSAALEAVVTKALELAPADRFQTATEFASALEVASRMALEPSDGKTGVKRRRWLRYAALGTAGALTIVAAAVSTMRRPREPVTGIPEGDPRRLAVLYFDDLSSDKHLGHVAAGLTENLIDQLSQVPVLRVISPNGVRTFRDTDLPLDTVARRLGAGTIIGGSVSSSGALLRVTVRLIDARTGAQLNSRTLQHPLWSLFRVQDSVTSDVALWLREHLGRQVRLRAQLASTTSVPAWELVQRGEELAREAGALLLKADPRAAEVFQRADAAFAAAETIDPKWPVPTVSRARNALSRAFVNTDRLGRPTPSFASQLYQAISYAERALARPPIIAEALTIRGEARMRLVALANAQPADSLLALADADLQRAATERPDAARSWYALGVVRFRQGRFSEAADAFQTAYETDAFLTNIRAVVSELFFATLFAGRFEEADRWCRMAQSRYPADPRFTQCGLNILGWAGRKPKDAASAWRLLAGIERSDSTAPSRNTWTFRRMMVAAVLARAAMRDSARAVIARAHGERGDRPTAYPAEAYVRVLLGEHDEALRLLRLHLAASPNDRAVIANHPWFREVHDDARFSALVDSR